MATTATPHEVELLRERVRLYLFILLVFDIFAYGTDVLDLVVGWDSPTPQLSPRYLALRWGASIILVSGWAIARFAKPGYATIVALEIVATTALAFSYVSLGAAYMTELVPEYGPPMAMLGILLLLSIRGALVPSPVLRTSLIGVAALLCWFAVTRDQLSGFHPIATEALVFVGVAFVVSTAITSRVIYGLRRQVRDAMRLGQYQLGRKIGEGGMGIVYEATHVMLRRPTAVKLLPIEKAGEKTIARFEREVQQTSRLEHPNSVYIYDYGRTPDGQFYYAMEYLDGVTLKELVQIAGPIGSARAAAILHQAASALAEAHALGLVHRDIKPANIMLCERAQVADTVKVLDFGLVKAVDNPEADQDITHANAVVGTPHYLAPEAITNPDDVGPASDVYALGAVGFFLVTGRHVFDAKTLIEVCSMHLNNQPEAPSAVLGGPLNPGLEELILSCLAKSPEERPSDGATLANKLAELELSGWTNEDATAWWQARPDRREEIGDIATERTQLAVDVEGR